jgi:pimeloyl-ACP methyl ester carboxylesterase
MRKLVAAVAVTSLIAAAFAATPSVAAVRKVRADGISFGRCDEAFLRKAHARCGSLSVPLNYDDPSGDQIQLAVSRILHTTPESEYQGVMLVNPGGPGGSGLELVTLGQFVPDHAGDAYDWIGFDPRGVGASEPAISCIPGYFHKNRPPYVPTTDEIEATWLERSERYADACEADAAELLPYMTTIDAARDMESIRVALGAVQINYYGYSYGTYLGQVYATMFPANVRRMVLDGNVDPRAVWYQANLDQDVAFERVIHIWFRWVAKYNRVYHLGTTESAVQRRFYTAQDALTSKPAGGVVGPDEWADVVLLAGYAQSLWTYLGELFSSWVHHHDAKKLIQTYKAVDGPGDDNGFAVYLAVLCTDAAWPTDWETWQADNWATHEEAPFFTWGNAWFNAPCFFWGAPPDVPLDVNGGTTAALLINETLDAATPYPGSLEVRRRFLGSSLIAEPGGTTHAGSLSGNACVDDKIAAFLTSGELPPRLPGDGPDVTCKPLPRPVPERLSRAPRLDRSLLARLLPATWRWRV